MPLTPQSAVDTTHHFLSTQRRSPTILLSHGSDHFSGIDDDDRDQLGSPTGGRNHLNLADSPSWNSAATLMQTPPLDHFCPFSNIPGRHRRRVHLAPKLNLSEPCCTRNRRCPCLLFVRTAVPASVTIRAGVQQATGECPNPALASPSASSGTSASASPRGKLSPKHKPAGRLRATLPATALPPPPAAAAACTCIRQRRSHISHTSAWWSRIYIPTLTGSLRRRRGRWDWSWGRVTAPSLVMPRMRSVTAWPPCGSQNYYVDPTRSSGCMGHYLSVYPVDQTCSRIQPVLGCGLSSRWPNFRPLT